MVKPKAILSLFDHSGQWSDPYKRNGYVVLRHDIKDGWDILANFPNQRCEPYNIVGVLCAVPCTDFAVSGARWWKGKEKLKVCTCCKNTIEHSVLLVMASLHIIDIVKPKWWVIENPVGRIRKLVPEIGPAKMFFDPCDFGEPYTKRTYLYGNFNTNLKRRRVKPVKGSMMHTLYGGKSERTKELRSVTPPGFAKAFYQANK